MREALARLAEDVRRLHRALVTLGRALQASFDRLKPALTPAKHSAVQFRPITHIGVDKPHHFPSGMDHLRPP